MHDLPYTTPDEDPFRVQLPARLAKHRTSLVTKWIHEQDESLATLQTLGEEEDIQPRSGTPTHPFLAYPDIARSSLDVAETSKRQDVDAFNYDLVDDDDIPEFPATPIKATKRLLKSSSTFRNLNLSFRSSATSSSIPISPSSPNHEPSSPRTSSSRYSLFARPSRLSTATFASAASSAAATSHTRSASLSTVNTMPPASPLPTVKSPQSSRWRPSILGHFPQSSSASAISIPRNSTPVYTPPRPSLSSADTSYTSGNSASQTATTLDTSFDSNLPLTPSSRPSFLESIRSKNRSSLSLFRPSHHLHVTPEAHASSSSILSSPDAPPPRPFALEFTGSSSSPPSLIGPGDVHRDRTLPRRIPFAMKSVNQYDNLLDDEDDLIERLNRHYVATAPAGEATVVGSLPAHPPAATIASASASSPSLSPPRSKVIPPCKPAPGSPQQKGSSKRDSGRSSLSFGSTGAFSRVAFGSLNSRHQKKKKLVISGVGVHETRKFDGVKKWCESFGEIRQISRVPNGDLHIEFRKAEVADTVCRIRAKVFISGVGSVHLSWITGDKR
ncbi:hypothetical protein BKA70DRAFT_1417728 [Coprinopsis sp. MPI-PUGE-AT-0042]|nr:hypothetical protein BKA70DRAFT_1417728 [Coprinopsis sp. MPI-PUGE-AT-0042]